jgi:transcriptional regulator with XRE-family HTH domain
MVMYCYDEGVDKKRKKRPRRVLLSDQLRLIIEDCGMTRYEIAKRTGIDQSTLTRFMSGERGLSTAALDTLGEFLDLEVVQRGRS